MQNARKHAISDVGTVKRLVVTLDPDAKSVFNTELIEAEQARQDAIAIAELDAGLGVPHEKVRAWLLKLAKGERAPPPTA